ncbi:HMA domain-containing protein OS=Streptomyces glaucescens OX=1907 GN=SGLAU_12480 PE=4 SV=1 [Streptomyces glaucescens]
MTCGHCKDTLTKAIAGCGRCSRVEVDIASGQVTVISSGDLDDKVITDVVRDAGYEITGRAA